MRHRRRRLTHLLHLLHLLMQQFLHAWGGHLAARLLHGHRCGHRLPRRFCARLLERLSVRLCEARLRRRVLRRLHRRAVLLDARRIVLKSGRGQLRGLHRHRRGAVFHVRNVGRLRCVRHRCACLRRHWLPRSICAACPDGTLPANAARGTRGSFAGDRACACDPSAPRYTRGSPPICADGSGRGTPLSCGGVPRAKFAAPCAGALANPGRGAGNVRLRRGDAMRGHAGRCGRSARLHPRLRGSARREEMHVVDSLLTEALLLRTRHDRAPQQFRCRSVSRLTVLLRERVVESGRRDRRTRRHDGAREATLRRLVIHPARSYRASAQYPAHRRRSADCASATDRPYTAAARPVARARMPMPATQ